MVEGEDDKYGMEYALKIRLVIVGEFNAET